MTPIFTYEGVDYPSYSKIIDRALYLKEDEQKDFIQAYLESGPHARGNIGYFAGYYDEATARRLWALFKTEHPVFGTDWPSPEAAFQMGQAWAKAELKKGLK